MRPGSSSLTQRHWRATEGEEQIQALGSLAGREMEESGREKAGRPGGGCAELQRPVSKADFKSHFFKSGRGHGKEGRDGGEEEEIVSSRTRISWMSVWVEIGLQKLSLAAVGKKKPVI